MKITSEWLSRKLGYGFSFDEDLPDPNQWTENAKAELGSIPKFDPWRLIAKKPDAKLIADLELPELGNFRGVDLSFEDLRYPTSISRAAANAKKLNNEEDRLRILLSKGKILESEFYRLTYSKFVDFTTWRDTVTRGVDNVLGHNPILNRFWHFWINYFSINVDTTRGELFGSYYLTLRSNLNSKFEDLLFNAVWHPAMQLYLSNQDSFGPNSKDAQWNRQQNNGNPTSINENLGRELLELYTISPAAGYDQDDVNGAANILSGWGMIYSNDKSDRFFHLNNHEPGPHKVLGKVYNSDNPEDDLQKMCRDLARHPQTAKNIATKLARHFISDTPPIDAIARIESSFRRSGGSLVEVHRAVIDEVIAAGMDHVKFQAPELWFWQVHRSSKAELPWIYGPDDSLRLERVLMEIGQLHGRTPQPNGWPDRDESWITPEYLDRRLRYANLVGGRLYKYENFDPFSYVLRLPRADDRLIERVRRAESYRVACAILFCSHQFLEA